MHWRDGNTSPTLEYAHVQVCSVRFRTQRTVFARPCRLTERGAGRAGRAFTLISTARVAPEKQASNVRLSAVLSQRDVSTLETVMRQKAYWELLRDPRWQRKRLEVMERENFTCQGCEATDKTLNVHHKIYRKGAMPWEYPEHELRCLCEECHEEEHHWRGRLNEALAKIDPGSIEEIVGYAEAIYALVRVFGDGETKTQPINWTAESYSHGRGYLACLLSKIPAAQVEGLIAASPITDREVWWLSREDCTADELEPKSSQGS